MLAVDPAIGKEEEARASAATQRGSQLSNAAARARDSIWGRKSEIHSMHGAKSGGQLRQLSRANNRTRQNHAVRKIHCQRHHVRLAQRIDRRIGDLRKTLLAVIPQASRQHRQKCRRRIVPHAPVRFLTMRQRRKQNLELVFGPASRRGHALRLLDRRRRNRRRGRRKLPHLWQRIARLLCRQPLQDFAPAKNRSRHWVRENHFARAQPLPLRDARFLEINQAGFGTGDQQPVMRQGIAQRTQAIAIQLRAHKLPVRKNQRRRPVPRLASLRQRRQRTAHIARQQWVILKRRRHHRQHGRLW